MLKTYISVPAGFTLAALLILAPSHHESTKHSAVKPVPVPASVPVRAATPQSQQEAMTFVHSAHPLKKQVRCEDAQYTYCVSTPTTMIARHGDEQSWTILRGTPTARDIALARAQVAKLAAETE